MLAVSEGSLFRGKFHKVHHGPAICVSYLGSRVLLAGNWSGLILLLVKLHGDWFLDYLLMALDLQDWHDKDPRWRPYLS